MTHHITILSADHPIQRDESTLEQFYRNRELRKLEVAKRMHKRAHLFASEFMRDEFPELTAEKVIEAVTRPPSKAKVQTLPQESAEAVWALPTVPGCDARLVRDRRSAGASLSPAASQSDGIGLRI